MNLPKDLKKGEAIIGNLKISLDKIGFPYMDYDGKSQKGYKSRFDLLEASIEQEDLVLKISYIKVNQYWILLLETTEPTTFFCGPNKKCLYEKECKNLAMENSNYCELHKEKSGNLLIRGKDIVKKTTAPISFFERDKYLKSEPK